MASETLNWSDPDDLGDRRAEAAGIRFKIIKSADGFGIVAYAGGDALTSGYSGVIEWRRTLRNCKARAEELLAARLSSTTN